MSNLCKFAGPSKKMAQALEAEGLYVEWPKHIRTVEDLAIEATYYTGANGYPYKKTVLIDLRDKLSIDTKSGVDNCISYALTDAYNAFDIDEEMKIHLGQRGAPDAAGLLADLQEADNRLWRFSLVADSVACGLPVPDKDDEAEITIRGKDARRICELLEKDAKCKSGVLNNEDKAFAKMISDELRNKIKGA